MAEETHLSEPEKGPNKRRIGNKKSSKGKKKPRKTFRLPEEAGNFKPKKIDKKMKKLFRKRAREYNSDDETGDEDEHEPKSDDEEANGGHFSSEEEEAGEDGDDQGRQDLNADDGDSENEEDDTVQPGIMKFTEGCRAFRMAFKSIIKKSVQDDALVSSLGLMLCEFVLGLNLQQWGCVKVLREICRDRFYQHIRSLLLKSLLKKRLNGRSTARLRRKNTW